LAVKPDETFWQRCVPVMGRSTMPPTAIRVAAGANYEANMGKQP